MALTAAQQEEMDKLKAIIKEMKDYRLISSSTFGNFGNGMVMDDLLARIEGKIQDVEST